MSGNGIASDHSTSTARTRVDAGRAVFVTTHWSVVLSAGGVDSVESRRALETLCLAYWYPLYAYARRRGYAPHDAQDLTQGFFARLLEHHWLASADPGRGRFRSFLLTAMNHYLATEWQKARAQKRGGGRAVLSLELAAAEQRYDLEPADGATPDKAFDKHWAITLLDHVVGQVEKEYHRQGKATVFAALKETLAGARESQPYAALAFRLGMTEGAVKVAVYRLRKRYRQLLRAEIANTVASPGEVDDEMKYLFRTLAGE